MEILFQDNKLFIFFWIILSLIISDKNESNSHVIVIATYIIAYLVCIIDVIKTLHAFLVVIIILFLYFEILGDEFKTKILNIFEMVIDFVYIMIFEYGLLYFSISLFLSTHFIIKKIKISYCSLILISSLILMLGCIMVSRQGFKLKLFTSMKKEIDNIKSYRDFISNKKIIENYKCILLIEDRDYYLRENNYTYFSLYFLKFKYFRKIFNYIKSIIFTNNRKERIRRSLRGYSTIEMQTIRTLAVEDGYFHVFKRKIYELIYPYLFFFP